MRIPIALPLGSMALPIATMSYMCAASRAPRPLWVFELLYKLGKLMYIGELRGIVRVALRWKSLGGFFLNI